MHFRFDFSSGKLLKIRCLVKTHVAAAAAKLGVVVVRFSLPAAILLEFYCWGGAIPMSRC